MKQRKHDVIIVGAGIGGLKLAELFNKSDLNVLLIEKNDSIKKLTKNYFGTFLEYVDRWNLEKYLIHKCGWGMYSTKVAYFNKLKGRSLCVLEMNPWAESLSLKCEVLTSTEIMDLKKTDDGIILIDKNKNEYFGKVIVDCSGIAQTISSLLDIDKSKCDFLNYVYIMENINLKNPNEMFYFQDSNLTNCGGWFHTLGPDKCLVGCAEFTGPGTLGAQELKKRLESYIENFKPLNKILKNAKIVEEFCMAGPTTTMHSSIVEDHYLAVGDAGGAGAPFIGDGFRMAFSMADSAYETIVNAFEKNDFRKKTLNGHYENFWKEFGKWYKWSTVFRFIWVRYLTNNEFNLMARNLKNLKDDDYYKIIVSKFSPIILYRLFTFKIALLVLKNALIFHILEPLGILKMPRRPLILK